MLFEKKIMNETKKTITFKLNGRSLTDDFIGEKSIDMRIYNNYLWGLPNDVILNSLLILMKFTR